jgi:transposase
MYHRHAIRDEDWERLKDLLPGREGQRGVTAKDNRLFIDAILWIAKTGAPWRDLPERFGKWNSVWRRFDRWARHGVWKKLFKHFQDPDLEWLILDSTVIRAHSHAAGARKKPDASGGAAEQALGRSRGGFGTKIHGAVSGLMLPVVLLLSAGQGLRQQGSGRQGRVDGSRSGHPHLAHTQRAARDRQGALQGPQPGRAFLAQSQAVPPRGDTLREDRPQLPCLRPGCFHHASASLTARWLALNCPHYLGGCLRNGSGLL